MSFVQIIYLYFYQYVVYDYINTQRNVSTLLFFLQASSVNLFSAETGRRLLDTTINFNLDPNGGKPEKVSFKYHPIYPITPSFLLSGWSS